MAARDPVEEVLYRTAEIARSSRSYGWMRRHSTRLLVQTQSKRLTAAIEQNEDLRARVRKYIIKNHRRAIEPIVFGQDIDQFKSELTAGGDVQRILATGLLHENTEVAHFSATLIHDGELLEEARQPGEESPFPEIQESRTPAQTPADVEIQQLESRIEELLTRVTAAQDERESASARADQLHAEVDTLTAKIEKANATIARLEGELTDLRNSIPSKNQQRKQKTQAKRAERFLAERDRLIARAEQAEIDRLNAMKELAAVRVESEETELELREEMRNHKRVRTTLEQKLEDPAGRAEYLARRVQADQDEIGRELEAIGHGRDRTKLTRKLQKLERLLELIQDLYLDSTEPLVEPEPPRIKVTATYDLRVVPLGGGTEVGGSAVLVEGGGKRILVDAGLRPQADTTDKMAPPEIAEALKGKLDAVFVTHAHTDHSGYVPAIVERYPGIKVIASPGTAALLPTMWDDSQKVSERRAATLNQYMAAAPLYGEAEVEAAEDRIEEVRYGQTKALGDVRFELFPAGHIVGAAGVVLRFGERKIVITGDISDEAQATVDGARIPKSAHGAELLLIESTYCHDTHRSRENQASEFVQSIERVLDGHGRVLIPAFGLGRAQEVALLLKEHLSEVPVLIDGLAGRISHVFEAHAREQGRHLEIFGGNIRQVEGWKHRERELKTFATGVVITTSGMMNGGPAVRWAQEILPDPHSALYLCGYQDEESPGSALLALANGSGAKTFNLSVSEGQIPVPVNARVALYHLSAHADRDGLTDIIREVSPQQTMLVHGLPKRQREFGTRLQQQGLRTTKTGEWTSR